MGHDCIRAHPGPVGRDDVASCDDVALFLQKLEPCRAVRIQRPRTTDVRRAVEPGRAPREALDQIAQGVELGQGGNVGQILHPRVEERMRADHVPLVDDPAQQLRYLDRGPPDDKERRRGLRRLQDIQNPVGGRGVRPVIEGQRDLKRRSRAEPLHLIGAGQHGIGLAGDQTRRGIAHEVTRPRLAGCHDPVERAMAPVGDKVGQRDRSQPFFDRRGGGGVEQGPKARILLAQTGKADIGQPEVVQNLEAVRKGCSIQHPDLMAPAGRIDETEVAVQG